VAYLDAVAYTEGAFVAGGGGPGLWRRPGGSDVLGGDGEPLEAAAALERPEMELGAGDRMLTRGRWDWVWGVFLQINRGDRGGWRVASCKILPPLI
jgi:hypothetical protein